MKSRLKRIAERQGNDWYAYHGTDKSYIENIQAEGVKPSSDGFVYLTYNQELAGSHYSNHHDNPVVIKVKLTNKNIEDIKEYNDAFPFWDVAKEYFESNILNTSEYKQVDEELPYSDVENGNTDFRDYFESGVEYEFGSLATQWMNQMLEYYFNDQEAELLVKGTIPPSQIVDIIE